MKTINKTKRRKVSGGSGNREYIQENLKQVGEINRFLIYEKEY